MTGECKKVREYCGVFGVYGSEQVVELIYQGLFSLQHRGQEGAGIVVSDGENITSMKNHGTVNEVFSPSSCEKLKGHMGIGHVRYSTTGSSRIQNVQPLVVECVDGLWAVAHNGNLVNAAKLRQMYQQAGAIFQTSTDSEVLVHILADPLYRNRPQRVARALRELRGAFSFLIMNKNSVMACRDPFGFRPLSIGKLGDAWIFASETCALNQIGAEYVRDVEPGELVTADSSGLKSSFFHESGTEPVSQCVFEMVYFSRPDSRVFGMNVHQVRKMYGEQLAKEHPVDADIVVAVPDSGNSAALGYAQQSGIPLDYGFIRNHYVGRTFIMPEQNQRYRGTDLKLAVVDEVVRGKRVIVVDDSIVRGTTARRRILRLKEAGAKEVHVRISSPPVMYPCFYGIDFPTKEELVAEKGDVAEICNWLGADTLGYVSIEGLLSPFKNRERFCTACFSGNYPVDPQGAVGKHVLELSTDRSNLQSEKNGVL
ncbi:Amidophosphoribosyltransferase [Chitinispirillum alkaliphilum]|nr:Amidophosphoribosyltransferase [Chitinispirillum alkaliphilum]